jgi:alpha-tubulin suppressor-like RCC1 family protein
LSNYVVDTPEGKKDVRVSQVACGKNHCIALLNIGSVLEWGGNEFGQLGNRKRTFTENPIIIKDFVEENVLKVCAKYDSTGVITEFREKKPEQKTEKK